MQDVRKSWRWQQLVAWAKRELPWVCHLCSHPIPHHVPRNHPHSYALDHVLTVRDHPEFALDPNNVAPSHKQCNEWRKARPVTPGLRVEAAEKFAPKPPAALGFFDVK